MKRTFFFDIDGTLYDQGVEESTRKAIQQLIKQNDNVVIADDTCANSGVRVLAALCGKKGYSHKIIVPGYVIRIFHTSHPSIGYYNAICAFCQDFRLHFSAFNI